MRKLFVLILVASIAATGGWFAAVRYHHDHAAPPSDETASGRKVKVYQCPMHPWVKSDKPGKCTVCGMNLVPIYEGGKDLDTPATDIVMLPQGSPNVMGVETSEVKKRRLQHTLRVAGVIEDDDSRHRILSAYTDGRIDALGVKFEGAEVTEGQMLATFFSRPLLAAASEYRLSLGQGGNVLEAAKNRLVQYGLTPAQIAAIPQRKEDDIHFDILAPVTGTVVKRFVYEGQYVREGDKLFELADFSTMWFMFIAYEQDLPFLHVGQSVEISAPSVPGKTFEAAIKFINPNVDDQTRSARVRVEVKNHGGELKHRVYAQGSVRTEAPEVLTVPRQAVLWPGLKPRVYIEKDAGMYQQRTVKLGRGGDDYWEVLDGLHEGDRVVTSGNMLIDGQAQLNNGAPPPDHEPEPTPVAMAEETQRSLKNYLNAVGAVSDALATDDLKGYEKAVAQLPAAPDGMIRSSLPAHARDLMEARRAFLPFSQEVVGLAAQFRSYLPGLKIFRCPMTQSLWDGAPGNAPWIQFNATPRNPYWGKEMLECAKEVK